ncbi:MAG: hypothetical protein OHK0022_09220 [Roseiflexaceae bacterium]
MSARTLRELFVNRDRQLVAFRRMIEGQSRRRIMLVQSGPGTGKSWLLRMFALETAARMLPTVQIDFTDGQAYDALALVRRCRDALGPEHFNAVTQALNDVTTARVAISAALPPQPPPISVTVGSDNTLTDSNIEVGTIIKDNNFVLQTDNPLVRQAAEDRINQAFFSSLKTLTLATRPVFLFDTYERTSLETDRWLPSVTDRWITGELLTRIMDGRLTNAVAVVAGTRLPEFGAEWNEVLGRMELELLDCVYVTEYLRERLGLTVITDAEATRLCEATGGNPQIMALIGDNLEQANKPKVQDEDW